MSLGNCSLGGGLVVRSPILPFTCSFIDFIVYEIAVTSIDRIKLC